MNTQVFLADSYKDSEIIGEPFLKNSKPYVTISMKCPRCGGSGNYSYNQLDGTMCYGCWGAGKVKKDVRAYTEKEYLATQKAKEAAKLKKEEERRAREEDLITNAAKYKHEVAKKLGFNDDEEIYLICGHNTYNIKDQLKAAGARFDSILKWYSATPIELPDGYFLCKISFDEVYTYEPLSKCASLKENLSEILTEKMANVVNRPVTEFYPAAIKDRLRDLTVEFSETYGFDGYYGHTYVYIFKLDNYVFKWMTQKYIEGLSVGQYVILTGTIKDFETRDGINETVLTRCTIDFPLG